MKSIKLQIFLLFLFVCSTSTFAEKSPYDFQIIVSKSKRILTVYADTKLLKSYRIGLGLNPIPPKDQEGDRATPEGEYFICHKNPHSTYSLALMLNYPNLADAERGKNKKLITESQYSQIVAAAKQKKCPPFHTRLGGEVEIHGMGSQSDWTWGCIALDNADVKELYEMISVGTSVIIEH